MYIREYFLLKDFSNRPAFCIFWEVLLFKGNHYFLTISKFIMIRNSNIYFSLLFLCLRMKSIISPLLRAISNYNVFSRNLSIFRSSAPTYNSQGLSCNTLMPSFLSPQLPILSQVSGFKVKLKLKRRCKDCYIVVRNQRGYNICPTHPRHNQMSLVKRPKYTWIISHASQSKYRPW